MKSLVTKNGSVVTVEVASKKLVDGLLDANVRNRSVKTGRVESLARDISTGNWRLNGATVVVGGDGVLLDGQHRLMAIRNLNYPPIELIVVRLSEEDDKTAMNTIDSGKSRTCADVFKLGGVKYASKCASITNTMVRVFHLGPSTSNVITRSTSREVYDRYSETISRFAELYNKDTVAYMVNCAAMSAFVAYAIAYPRKADDIISLVVKVANADELKKGTAAYALHKFLLVSKSEGRFGSGTRQEKLVSAVVCGIDHHVNGEPCSFVKGDTRLIENISKMIK